MVTEGLVALVAAVGLYNTSQTHFFSAASPLSYFTLIPYQVVKDIYLEVPLFPSYQTPSPALCLNPSLCYPYLAFMQNFLKILEKSCGVTSYALCASAKHFAGQRTLQPKGVCHPGGFAKEPSLWDEVLCGAK